jgi:hypothetical protein
VNLGLVYLACNEPDEAARMYAAALIKFCNKEDEFHHHIDANTLYELACIRRGMLRSSHTPLFSSRVSLPEPPNICMVCRCG